MSLTGCTCQCRYSYMSHAIPKQIGIELDETVEETIRLDRCPICLDTRHRFFEAVKGVGRKLSYDICEHCGLVFQTPRLTHSVLDAMYKGDYRLSVQGIEGPVKKDLEFQLARAYCLGRMLGRVTANVSRHLDVGCSSGALLAVLGQRYGCVSVGVEPGTGYSAFARARGILVFPRLDDLARAQTELFDLISLSHVLEHMPNPVEELRDLREHFITPDGHLLVEVPNLYEHSSLEPTHLTAFNVVALRDTLRMAGFKPWFTRVHGGFRSDVLGLYITMIATPVPKQHPYKVPHRSSTVVRLRRRLGRAKVAILSRILSPRAWKMPAKSDTEWPSAGSLRVAIALSLAVLGANLRTISEVMPVGF